MSITIIPHAVDCLNFIVFTLTYISKLGIRFVMIQFKILALFNPYNAELILYKSCRPKGFNLFEIILNVLVSSF